MKFQEVLKAIKRPQPADLANIDVPRLICNHLVGENHSTGHRFLSGVIIMIVGVAISKTGSGYLMHMLVDVVGYGLHGVGLVPFVDKIVAAYRIDKPVTVTKKGDSNYGAE